VEKMRTFAQVISLLDVLEYNIADDLEAQDLDFKEWSIRSFDDNIKKILDMAICMANGGGGHTIFGVADKVKGRANAIKGVPEGIDCDAIIRRVYEKTDPKLQVALQEVKVAEGTGSILILSVTGEMRPYTTSSGSATTRQGKDCIPLTGSLRQQMINRTSDFDYTSELLPGDWSKYISSVAFERVRENMSNSNVPEELCNQSDGDLLKSIGALKDGQLTKAGLLVFGRKEKIQELMPNHRWSYRRMLSDTDYEQRDDGYDPIPVAAYELERYVNVSNPVATIENGLFHNEYHTYPKIAIREALMNAFSHRDYQMSGAVMVKQYPTKLQLTNPGNFLGDIRPDNILHHPSTPRNHHLMELLDRLHLVNRTNIGVPRIYKSLLIEGKEPPIYREVGSQIELTIIASNFFPAFQAYIKELETKGMVLGVDDLLVLQYLIRHEDIDSTKVAEIIQRDIDQARELLGRLSNEFNLIEAVGRGTGRYYTLSSYSATQLKGEMSYERNVVLDIEKVKIQLLSILEKKVLTNKEIRQLTGWSRQKVYDLMKELSNEKKVEIIVRGRGSYYQLNDG